jgi:hypothetical protein
VKVSELIEKLTQLPQDLPVTMANDEYGDWIPVGEVKVMHGWQSSGDAINEGVKPSYVKAPANDVTFVGMS